MKTPTKHPYWHRLISLLVLVCFCVTNINIAFVHAQEVSLPAPGAMVHLSPSFNPSILKGIKIHSDNPFRFDFILDRGNSNLADEDLKNESTRLIKYFLASVTIPEKDLWVNLSPYEKGRIIPPSFGLTEMGRDLLAQDYMLKQITASLIYPEDEIGKKFWKRIYEEAEKKYGTSNIPVNTFNKVWIVPEKAVVYENAKAGTAYVVESTLKVMLEQDYLSLEKNTETKSDAIQVKDTNQLGSKIIREIVIPELTKEVNQGKNFIQLRQVYNSLILAMWYKKKIKESILNKVYSDRNKVSGLSFPKASIENPDSIYQQYILAFKKGVYNYIKEEQDPLTQQMVPRKYFSGGATFMGLADSAMTIKDMRQAGDLPNIKGVVVSMQVQDIKPGEETADNAMISVKEKFLAKQEKFYKSKNDERINIPNDLFAPQKSGQLLLSKGSLYLPKLVTFGNKGHHITVPKGTVAMRYVFDKKVWKGIEFIGTHNGEAFARTMSVDENNILGWTAAGAIKDGFLSLQEEKFKAKSQEEIAIPEALVTKARESLKIGKGAIYTPDGVTWEILGTSLYMPVGLYAMRYVFVNGEWQGLEFLGKENSGKIIVKRLLLDDKKNLDWLETSFNAEALLLGKAQKKSQQDDFLRQQEEAYAGKTNEEVEIPSGLIGDSGLIKTAVFLPPGISFTPTDKYLVVSDKFHAIRFTYENGVWKGIDFLGESDGKSVIKRMILKRKELNWEGSTEKKTAKESFLDLQWKAYAAHDGKTLNIPEELKTTRKDGYKVLADGYIYLPEGMSLGARIVLSFDFDRMRFIFQDNVLKGIEFIGPTSSRRMVADDSGVFNWAVANTSLSKEKALAILDKNGWNIEKSKPELGIDNNEVNFSILTYFERMELKEELRAKVLEILKANEGVYGKAADQMGVDRSVFWKWREKLSLDESPKSKTEILAVITEANWNLGSVADRLGRRGRENISQWLARMDITEEAKTAIQQKFDSYLGSVNAVANAFGIPRVTMQALMDDLGGFNEESEDQKKKQVEDYLRQPDWTIRGMLDHFGVPDNTGIYDFIEQYGAINLFREKLEEVLKANNWDYQTTGQYLGLHAVTLSKVIERVGGLEKPENVTLKEGIKQALESPEREKESLSPRVPRPTSPPKIVIELKDQIQKSLVGQSPETLAQLPDLPSYRIQAGEDGKVVLANLDGRDITVVVPGNQEYRVGAIRELNGEVIIQVQQLQQNQQGSLRDTQAFYFRFQENSLIPVELEPIPLTRDTILEFMNQNKWRLGKLRHRLGNIRGFYQFFADLNLVDELTVALNDSLARNNNQVGPLSEDWDLHFAAIHNLIAELNIDISPQRFIYTDKDLSDYPLIPQIIEAYKQLENRTEGSHVEIGDVKELCNPNQGYLKAVFPNSDGKKIGRPLRVGLGKNVTTLKLTMEKTGQNIVLLFTFTNAEKTEEQTAKVVWDKKTNNYVDYKEITIQNIREAQVKSADLKPREQIVIGSINDLANLKAALLNGSFPTPNGKSLFTSKQKLSSFSFGGSFNMKDLQLSIGKDDRGDVFHLFTYIDKNDKPGFSRLFWNDKEEIFESNQQRQVRKVKQAYETLKGLPERQLVRAGSITDIMVKTIGRLAASFPLFDGTNVGAQVRIQVSGAAGKEIQRMELSLERRDGGIYYIIVYDTDQQKNITSTLFWDIKEKRFYTMEELAIQHVQDAYARLKRNTKDVTIEIGNSNDLFSVTTGTFKRAFLLPNGQPIEGIQYTGTGRFFQVSQLTLSRVEGVLSFHIDYVAENGQLMRSTLIWDEVNQKLVDPQQQEYKHANNDYVAFQRHTQIALQLLLGSTDSDIAIDLGDVSGFINWNDGGILPKDFPLPFGVTLGQTYAIPWEGNPANVNLSIEIRKDHQMYYVFSYLDENGNLKKIERLWNRQEQKLNELVDQKEESASLLDTINQNQWQLGSIRDQIGMDENVYAFFKNAGLVFEFKQKLVRILNDSGWDVKSASKTLGLPEQGFQALLNRIGLGQQRRFLYDAFSQRLERTRRILMQADFAMKVVVGDVTAHFYLPGGQMKGTFPCPNGLVGEFRTIGLGYNLKTVNLIMEKREDGVVYYIFDATKEDGSSSHSELIWDSERRVYVQTQRHATDAIVEEVIEKEGLSDVISKLADDPRTLLDYLFLTTTLDPKVIQQIVRQSFEGFRGIAQEEVDFSDYQKIAGTVIFKEEIPQETSEFSVILEGKVEGNFNQIQITGSRNRIIAVHNDGTFRARIILRPGEKVYLAVVPFNQEQKTLGQPIKVDIKQTSDPKDIETIIRDLIELKSDLVETLKKDETQLKYLRKRLEISLLGQFTEDEKKGFVYLQEKVKQVTNEGVRVLYQQILKKFKKIAMVENGGIEDFRIEGFNEHERIFFYQKYAIYEVMQSIRDYEQGKTDIIPAKVLALEQGLGKTLVALTVARDNKSGSLVVAPNSVVSGWAEQDGHFFNKSKAVPVRGSSQEKTRQLNNADTGSIRMVNIEYLRSEAESRFDALNKNNKQVVVLDESQAFSREGSLQTQGARKLKGKYTLLISATPFANAQSARSLLKFMTQQAGFGDANVFNKYFMDDPDSIRLLHFLIDQYVIRIKKKHVFKTYDPSVPLEQQNNRLPKKEYIKPENLGEYELTDQQTDSIFDLFLNWQTWKQKKEELTTAKKAINTQDDTERSKAAGNGQGFFFAKMHSLRQLMNDPKYIGIEQESPKHKKMDEIINEEVVRRKGKVVIFAAYKEQVKAYANRYAKYGAVTYDGDTLHDQQNSRGYLVDSKGKERTFRKINKFEYAIDENGHLIEDSKGDPITPLDFNRYRFQNDPNTKVLVTIYDVGGVGSTFTAADAEIFDDYGRDYTVMYQAEDRNNRIDNLRKKYQTRYYRLQARYPQSFLDKLKGKYAVFDRQDGSAQIFNEMPRNLTSTQKAYDLHKLFSNGTYDQIQGHNIMNVQKELFELVLDGLEDEEDLDLLSQEQLKAKMPFLFEGTRLLKEHDEAMLSNPGGIDLTDNKTPLEIQNSGEEMKFNVDPAMLQQLQNASGFVPVIINIQPLKDLPAFLGVNVLDKPKQLALNINLRDVYGKT